MQDLQQTMEQVLIQTLSQTLLEQQVLMLISELALSLNDKATFINGVTSNAEYAVGYHLGYQTCRCCKLHWWFFSD